MISIAYARYFQYQPEYLFILKKLEKLAEQGIVLTLAPHSTLHRVYRDEVKLRTIRYIGNIVYFMYEQNL